MNKTQLIEEAASAAGLSRKEMSKALDAVLNTILTSLSHREQVALVGFGTFDVRERSARDAKNPRTREVLHLPAVTVPVFKSGKLLKEVVAGKVVVPNVKELAE